MVSLNFTNHDPHEKARESVDISASMIERAFPQDASGLLELAAGIVRAHAVATVPHFEERERLEGLRKQHAQRAVEMRKEARALMESALECDETSTRILEQMAVLR
jgi:hypothetical protein